ncbi:hypothetical protein B0H12DRAFT_1320840, partial [Mycena haematopus]
MHSQPRCGTRSPSRPLRGARLMLGNGHEIPDRSLFQMLKSVCPRFTNHAVCSAKELSMAVYRKLCLLPTHRFPSISSTRMSFPGARISTEGNSNSSPSIFSSKLRTLPACASTVLALLSTRSKPSWTSGRILRRVSMRTLQVRLWMPSGMPVTK